METPPLLPAIWSAALTQSRLPFCGGELGSYAYYDRAFLKVRWPQRSLAVIVLGLCFFGLFFVLYDIAVSYTTAARASLALSMLPLQTMIVGALLGIEPLTGRKTMGGCGPWCLRLAFGLSAAPSGAWRGELIMTGAVLCMAFYNVWSRAGHFPNRRPMSLLG
ncbi:MAG: EamA family transporter [Pseudolabrys sp.]